MRRRTVLATTAGVGAGLLAGCTGGGGTDAGNTGSGALQLLVSDQQAAIEDFDSLDVTLSSARVFRAGDDEELTPTVLNGTAAESPASPTDATEGTGTDGGDGAEGFVTFDLDSVTVDLTRVIGDRAVSVLEGELDEGRYSGIELQVSAAEGVVDGETVDVMVPSNRLRIVRPFEVAPDEELSFVFDISVVKKGRTGRYNLLPVIGKSGVAGEDVEVEEVDAEGGTGTGTAAGNATATDGGA